MVFEPCHLNLRTLCRSDDDQRSIVFMRRIGLDSYDSQIPLHVRCFILFLFIGALLCFLWRRRGRIVWISGLDSGVADGL